MKRLNLEDFKAKNLTAHQAEATDMLLGQVLGDCHDEPNDDDDGNLVGDILGGAFNAGRKVGEFLGNLFN